LGGSKEAIQSEMDIILLAVRVRVHGKENGRTQIKSVVVVANEAK
jgi:hypothetical protein